MTVVTCYLCNTSLKLHIDRTGEKTSAFMFLSIPNRPVNARLV